MCLYNEYHIYDGETNMIYGREKNVTERDEQIDVRLFIKGYCLGLFLQILGLIISLVDGRPSFRRGATKGILTWFIIPPIIWIITGIIKGIIYLVNRNKNSKESVKR